MQTVMRSSANVELEKTAYWGYVEGVLSGKVTAGLYIKQACEHFLALLGNEQYEFRPQAVMRVVDFVGCLSHFEDAHSGRKFVLEPWQEFLVASMYGFFWRGTDRRLVRNAYVEVARKNGKSALAAALALYHLMFDNVMGAQVYLAANSREQVKISSWNLCSNFVRSIVKVPAGGVGRTLSLYRDRIVVHKTKSFLKVLAADSAKLDGPNPSMWILDEYHAAKSASMKDVLQSGQGMRENPLGMIVTTAGFDLLGACYEYRQGCTEVLGGVKSDDSLFTAIYSLDEDDDYKDETTWAKANPNLGVTLRHEFLRNEIHRASTFSSEEDGVKTKNLNIWCSSTKTWLSDKYIFPACTERIDPKDFTSCWVGIDLGATSDLTAMSALMVDEEGRLCFKVWYYLPEAALEENRFKVLYGAWRREGWLTVTPGNVTDYDFVLADMVKLRQACRIMTVGYDAWNATQFVIQATDARFPMEPVSQSVGNYNKPTKELERLLKDRKVRIDNNGITLHGFRNVELMTDHHGNIKPSKRQAEKKIDGVIAMLNALGVYLGSRRYNNRLF